MKSLLLPRRCADNATPIVLRPGRGLSIRLSIERARRARPVWCIPTIVIASTFATLSVNSASDAVRPRNLSKWLERLLRRHTCPSGNASAREERLLAKTIELWVITGSSALTIREKQRYNLTVIFVLDDDLNRYVSEKECIAIFSRLFSIASAPGTA